MDMVSVEPQEFKHLPLAIYIIESSFVTIKIIRSALSCLVMSVTSDSVVELSGERVLFV